MPSFDNISIDFEIYCGGCGDGICHLGNTRQSRNRGYPQVVIEPCKKCLDAAKSEGYEERRNEEE